MAVPAAPEPSVDLRAVTVRPARGWRGHLLRDRLVAERHCLPFHGIVGKGLLPGSRCTAAGRVQAGGARPLDRAVAGAAVLPPAPGLQRLPLRHPVPGRVPDLASRVPGPGLRRLSADIEAAHGCPGPARGDVRRRLEVHGDLLRRVEPALAGADARLRARVRRNGALGTAPDQHPFLIHGATQDCACETGVASVMVAVVGPAKVQREAGTVRQPT